MGRMLSRVQGNILFGNGLLVRGAGDRGSDQGRGFRDGIGVQ